MEQPSVDTPARRGPAVGAVLVLAVAIAVLALGGAALGTGVVPCALVGTQPACEVALLPGPTEDTLALVDIDGTTTFPSSGQLLLTTIAVRDDLDWAGWWQARRTPQVDVVARTTVFPEGSELEDVSEQNRLLMEDSQLSAAVAALRAAGFDVEPDGAEVAAVEADAVTHDLAVGDVVTAVDGMATPEAADVVAVVGGRAPGDEVVLAVRPGDGAPREVTVTLGASPEDARRAYIGVLLRTAIDLPVDVVIDAGVIGGPSAGLMFALGVVDLLAEDDLTGGRVVAGTGTISSQGQVGAVGGVRQKVAGASTARGAEPAADVFLVPRGNLAEARAAPRGEDLLLVPVDDLDQALDALAALRAGREPAGALALAGPEGD